MSQDKELLRKQKQKIYSEWIKGDHLLVHLDSRKEGVVVPEDLLDDPALTLKISYLFQGQTSEDEVAITSYLKFTDEYFKCVIPWDSIWGITSEGSEQKIWPEDLPKVLITQAAKSKLKELRSNLFSSKKETKEKDEKNKKRKKPDLKLIK